MTPQSSASESKTAPILAHVVHENESGLKGLHSDRVPYVPALRLGQLDIFAGFQLKFERIECCSVHREQCRGDFDCIAEYRNPGHPADVFD